MDPLSVVSGIVGTVAFGAKVLSALHGLAEGVRSAPEELGLLAREVEDLCKIMDNFQKKTRGQIVNQDIEDGSRAILDIFERLEQLIAEHTIFEKDGFLKKGWKQVKWYCIEKGVADLRAHLNSNKGNLLVALALAHELQNGHSNMKLERVQGTLDEVVERLQDHGMQTVATCESFTLQRWQEVPSTIPLSSRPTTPDGRVSVPPSESGILSEAGFSERSIPMSAYQFNDMGTRGIGVLVSDGTQTKAYTVRNGKHRGASDSRPPEAGAPRAGSPRIGSPRAGSPRIGSPRTGSPASFSTPPTRSSKSTPLVSIPEPEEGDGAQGGRDDSKPGEAPTRQEFIAIPSRREGLKLRGALRSAWNHLENIRKPRSKVEELKDGGAVHQLRDASLAVILNAPPLRVMDCEPATRRESSKLVVERFLQVLKASPDLTSGNLFGGPGKREDICYMPPYRPDFLIAGDVFSDGPVPLETTGPPTLSGDDFFPLQAHRRVRPVSYTNGEWSHDRAHPEGVVTQFRRAEFRHAPKPRDEEMRMGEEERQMLALFLEDGLGIGGDHTPREIVGDVVISLPVVLMEVISVRRVHIIGAVVGAVLLY
ncbi:hypothetical protein C7212DRAFT_353666 [Tuber magnatum]|uniref:Fungal N-terminal domain-containing protein n=1 Tax=Tuber magnatum TaxID=42249 RepID=A0A317SHT0_9PEZI|nr:hypothetical protein C7212DRAFT_353666 [Tuber magnatum]